MKEIPEDLLNHMAWICSHICKLDLNIGSIDHVISQIRHFLLSKFESSITDGMWATSNLLLKDKDGVIVDKLIGAEPKILQIAVNYMGSDD